MAAICDSSKRSKSTTLRLVFIPLSLRDSVTRASPADMPWAMKVAQATPATPQWNFATNQ